MRSKVSARDEELLYFEIVGVIDLKTFGQLLVSEVFKI